MKTYAERVCFTPRQLKSLTIATALVAKVSDRWGNELRCHELARAVANLMVCVDLVDGKRGPIEHSWLTCADRDRVAILDVYTPGHLPSVQLIDPLVVHGAYIPGHRRTDIRVSVVRDLLEEMGLLTRKILVL